MIFKDHFHIFLAPAEAADPHASQAESLASSHTEGLAHIAADLRPLATAVAACILDPGNGRIGPKIIAWP